MQSNATRDLWVGLFVLAGFVALGYLSLQVGGLEIGRGDRMVLRATFDNIGGLSVRAPVRIAGVKIGQVSGIDLDEDLRAEVALEVDSDLELSIDSAAAIRTAGLLGDQFISVELGAEDEFLRPGEEFTFTESAFSIDRLIGQVIHDAGIGD
ncbi:MAG: outer membrane lipid asymmetry maintenance protein MlaD [Deltaproteobacteria bacterium]|jgi:phospholipid/cholesterol/gamma-HCH transport system substrate-binding protein|nr:outer membrane lipid asymmetry maintenance protein MlaD [Deltaproteobacteria bacterium]MBW2495807.1 outer membrane lipid asymmetry maintenance protein MlaD [Deltaproteobacteria bacterium]